MIKHFSGQWLTQNQQQLAGLRQVLAEKRVGINQY